MNFNKGLMITNIDELEKDNEYIFEICKLSKYSCNSEELSRIDDFNGIYTYTGKITNTCLYTGNKNYLKAYKFKNLIYELNILSYNLENCDGNYIVNITNFTQNKRISLWGNGSIFESTNEYTLK
jgi:hypothetical protein